ncbi:MAG: hypothetical protein U1E73_06630 [Planctomycetota bacterium]
MPLRAARPFTLLLLAAVTAAQEAAVAPTPTPPAVDLALLADLKARGIGPAVCSGRIGAVAGVPGDPTIVWVGAASGGVWKSTDGGVTFAPVFDDQDCTSVGAIAISARSPDDVWVGTGEGNPRNSASVGRGVYRTRDGGRTWSKLGLEHSERIHRIVLHPGDPDTAYATAMGTTWGESEDRGVYRTRDGGKTWQRILHVDPRTGGNDLAMDPRDPLKMFASMWDHRRWPWAFRSGGPGSALYRTLDGGDTWTRLTDKDGLPKGELGRIGLAIAPSDPRIVYALVEAEKSVLLRSEDGGFAFSVVNRGDDIAPRPFYFCDVRVDPHDVNRVYNLHMVVDMSTDGGRTFSTLIGWNAAHPDHHAMWIDPLDPERILIGNDGGVYQSQDRGASWRFCQNLPLAQFYHVAVDDAEPFHVYGGLQDNGSWRGPSTVWENGGIRNLHWQEVCFGDGFATLPMPDDANRGYAMSQGGSLIRWDLRTGSQKGIRPPAPEGTELRFNWNAAIAQDPFDAATIWYGSQFLHKSPDRGESWEVMSPDLTSDNPEWQKQDESGGLSIDVTGAENHCTIMTIAPSPVQKGVLWVGTDDGRVQVTRDGCRSWQSVEGRAPGLPHNTWCPHIEASKYDAATAYAVFDGHRNADWTPYVYVTRDYGQSWTSLATPAIDGYCLVLEQDPIARNLLWLGTEFGLFVSFDEGASWQRWKHGVPACSAMAITTQPRTGDVVVATHGRSLFVLDDPGALRAMTPAILQEKLHVFPPQPATLFATAQTPSSRFPGNGEFRGEMRRRGVLLDVVCTARDLKRPDDKEPLGSASDDVEPKPDEVTIEVRDAGGALVRTFRRKVHAGLNRLVWGLDRDARPGPAHDLQEDPKLPFGGREVLPGDYELTVLFQGESGKVKATVRPDPRVEIAMADRVAKEALRARAEDLRTELRPSTQALARCQRDLDLVAKRLDLEAKVEKGADDPLAALRSALDAAKKAHEELSARIWGKKPKQGITRDDDTMMSRFMAELRISGTDDAPNPTELQALDRAMVRMRAIADAVAAFEQGPMAALRTELQKSGLGLLPPAK